MWVESPKLATYRHLCCFVLVRARRYKIIMGISKVLVIVVLLNALLMSVHQLATGQEIEENNEESEDEQIYVEATSLPTEATTVTPKPPSITIGTTVAPPKRRPCQCTEGACKCCSGAILSRFNYTQRNKACVNVNYDPDDFEFHYKLMFNDRVLLQNKISGKNPRPVCIPVIQRFFPGNLCLKFSNVYTIGRNLHACIEMQGVWNESELFGVSFDCFRIGANGVAIVKPEEGGGLPTQVVEQVLSPEEEDYDDSAKSYITSNQTSTLTGDT